MPQINNSRHKQCKICARLKDYEHGFQKGGRAEDDVYIPSAASLLNTVQDLKPGGGNRVLWLEQCPECGTYYLYKTDYEYLVSGTEDEQALTRLMDEEASKYLQEPKA